MNQRIIAFFIALFIIVNIVVNLFSTEAKQFAASKFALAINYYKERAQYYYGRFSGTVPSDFVVQHYYEWRNFSHISDVLVMDLKQAEELFRIYVQTRNDVFQTIHQMRNDPPENDPSTDRKQPRFFRRPDFGRLEREFAAAFEKTIQTMLSSQEIAAVSEILANDRFLPDAELRGLRYVRLEEKQRNALKPFALELMKSKRSNAPDFDPMRGPWSRSIRNEFNARQDVDLSQNERYQLAKQDFLNKVEETLNSKQKKQWMDGRAMAMAEIQDRTIRIVTKRPSRENRNTIMSHERSDRLSAESS